MRKFVATLAFALAIGARAMTAQAAVEGTLYPSMLRAGVRGAEIVLTWIDAPGAAGATYLVFRAKSPINETTFAGANLIAEVPAGVQGFTDFPPDISPYYYAVIVKDSKGTVHRVFRPTVNCLAAGVAVATPRTTTAVSSETSPATSTASTAPSASAATISSAATTPAASAASTESPAAPAASAIVPAAPAASAIVPAAPSSSASGLSMSGVPTKLRVGVRDAQIAITWSPGIDTTGGFYLVYRHSEAITQTTLTKASLIAELPSTVFEYIDTPSSAIGYFYAVLFRKSDGSVIKTVVPFENASTLAVVPKTTETLADAVSIRSIAAVVEGSGITVSYRASKAGSRLVIYRGLVPIVDMKTLLESTLVAVFTDSGESFVDYPVPGISYYYAIIEESQLKLGAIVLVTGQNSTDKAIQVPAGSYRSGLPSVPDSFRRTLPLPYLALTKSVSDGDILSPGIAIPDRSALSPATLKAVDSILAGLPAPVTTAPRNSLLPADMLDATGSEDYTLKLILKEQFLKGNYQGTIVQLQNFLSIYRSSEIAARAHFYLGQAYAMLGYYREAFFEFLQAQTLYYLESEPWIDYLLTVMHRT